MDIDQYLRELKWPLDQAGEDWVRKCGSMVEAWRECPNVSWLIGMHPPPHPKVSDWWRLAVCDSIRAEVWEYLYADESGVVGGTPPAGAAQENLGREGRACWCVPSEPRRLVCEVEKCVLPSYRADLHLTDAGPPGDINKVVSEFRTWRLFTAPHWSAYNLAFNACLSAGSFYAGNVLHGFDYVRRAVGLMAVLNAEGKTPVVGEEYEGNPAERKVYREAVAACSGRQAVTVRMRFGNPFAWGKKS